jgi:hypothetical protein
MSYLSDHFKRVSAAQQAKQSVDPAASEREATRTEYERQLILLDTHKQQLSQIQSVEAKAKRKLELLPEYSAYVTGVLDAGTSAQDNIIVTMMLWHFDVGQLSKGIELASFALENKMVMPEGHKRTLATVAAEEIADHVLAGVMSDDDRVDILETISTALAVTEGEDMPDQVRAKLYKAYGRALREGGELETALSALNRAMELDKGVGVKKDIETLEREIRKYQTQSEDEPSAV